MKKQTVEKINANGMKRLLTTDSGEMITTPGELAGRKQSGGKT